MTKRIAAGVEAHRNAGFTLFEMLVALAVISVATGVIVKLFTASLDVSANSRQQRIASLLAEETLQYIAANPAACDWSGVTGQELVRVGMKPGMDIDVLMPPSTQPVVASAAARSRAAYAGFACEVYGRLSVQNAAFYEVTAVVRWSDNGRPHLIALSGAAPRPRTEQPR